MTSIGADPDALDHLARALSGASSELDGVVRRVDGALARSGWSGQDGVRFRRSWTGVQRRRLQDAALRCRTLSRQVARSADEQRRASTSTGAPTARGRLAPLHDSTVHRGELTASIGPITASLAGTLAIEEVGDRRRVTYSDEARVGAGVTAGRGTTARLGDVDASSGAVAAADASLENTVRRTWVVDADEVDGLLLALAVEQGLTHLPGVLERAQSQGARVLGVLGDAVGIEAPESVRRLGDGTAVAMGALPVPIRTEDLVGVELSGTALAALGVGATGLGSGGPRPAGGAASGSTVRVGTAVDGGRSSLVLEAEGDAAARIGAGFGGRRAVLGPGSSSVRVEVPVDSGGEPMLITITTGDDERAVTRIAVDPEVGTAALDSTRRAIERSTRGDPAGGLAELTRIELPDRGVHIEQAIEGRRSADGELSVTTPAAAISFEGTSERRSMRP